jgi:methyl-accepting chemotaxis protein
MKFSDLKVATWLSIAFGIMVALSIAAGALALSKLSGIAANLEDVVKDNNVKIKLNNDMSESVHVVARVLRTVTLLDDPAARAKEAEKIRAARDAYDRQWALLQKYPASDRGQQNRSKISAAASASRPANDRVMELAMSERRNDAIAFLLSEAGPVAERWQSAIDENLTFQEEQNEAQFVAAQADYVHARKLLIGLNVFVIAVAVLMGVGITRGITRALGAEPGEAAELARRVALGDLSVPIRLRTGDVQSLMAQLVSMQKSLATVVGQVRTNSESVSTASAEIEQANLDLSQRTEEQASALEQTAASMEQFGSTVRNNAENANQANVQARQASKVAAHGGDMVGKVVETMRGINDSSAKISDIIGVIDAIAFQTNILALNAAVEAARAGEQGRGFAVVASEVRSLAGRSAAAAKEIKTLIGTSVERVGQGSQLVNEAGAVMSEVVVAIKRVTDLVGEISTASNEQSQGVAQIGEAINQMDQVTQQNAALVEQMAAAASSLQNQARSLVASVSVFRIVELKHSSFEVG